MKGWTGLVSLIGHPLFLPFYFLTSTLFLIPNYYGFPFAQKSLLLVFQTFIITILLPGVAILLMSKLGLIGSITMENRKERFIPIVVVLTFYLWYFINIRDLPFLLNNYRHYTLGVLIGLVLLLLITMFFKVSMHASSWTIMIFYSFLVSHQDFTTYQFASQDLLHISKIYPWFFMALGLLIIFARFKMGAHSRKELLAGIVLGLTCGILSYIIRI